MGTVTMCSALNEEEMLGECLASATGLVQEIVVVDTGSTDATVKSQSLLVRKLFTFRGTGTSRRLGMPPYHMRRANGSYDGCR